MMNAGLGAIAPNANPMAAQPQPFKELLALNEAVKAANLARAAQGQQAMAQAQQQPPTVKDQLMMALKQALGASNYGFAGGGIVAFADGGDINPADLEALDADIVADTMSGFGANPEAAAVDELRVQDVPTRKRIRELESRIRELESRSPYNTQLGPLRQELARLKGSLTSVPPAPAPAGAGVTPRPAPAGAGAPAPLPASRPVVALQPLTPPAAGAAPGPGAGLGAAPGPGPAAGRIDFAELRKTQEALAGLAGQRGAVSPAVTAAREEFDRLSRTALDPAEQQLRQLEAQQQRGIFEDPEALAAMLSGMRSDMRLGETLMAMGAGAAKTRAGRETRVRDARDKLAQLRSDLALTQAKERLARAEGDDRAAREAQTKQAEIKAQIAATTVDLQFRERDFGLRERQVGAQERTARAQEIAASQRPTAEDRGRLTDNQRALLRERAIDNVAKDTNTVALIARARAQAARDKVPFDESAFREQLIQRQYESLVAAAEGRTIAPTPGPASGATTQTQGWGQPQVVPKP